MEWDFKMIPWDLAELEPNAEPAMGAMVRPDGCGLGQGTSMPDCSVDLKLGGSGDFGQSERWKNQPRGPAMPPASASSKRARAPSNGGQVASCLVDGCKSDLSKCREYHRRHKVCEVHSKTQIVMVGGQEQRFCQQCSRFHLLVEFDEVKRSCRKRLDGHNRRRRKPQPDPLNSVSLFANHQGGRLTSFPPIFPTTSPGPNWPGMIKTEEEALYSNQQTLSFIGAQQTLPSSFSISFKDGKKFPFLQDGDTVLSSRTSLEATVCQPLPETVSSSESSSTKMFPDGMTTHVLDPKCALSLLSWPSQSAAINLGEMVPADRIPIGQPLVSSLAYNALGQYSDSQASSSVSPTGFSCSGMGDEHGGTVLVSDASDAEYHCHGIFHVGGGGSTAGASQALPFWQ